MAKTEINRDSVKKARIAAGIPPQTIAKAMGMSVGNYYKKEYGLLRFSLEDAKKLADFYGKSIEDIFFAKEA